MKNISNYYNIIFDKIINVSLNKKVLLLALLIFASTNASLFIYYPVKSKLSNLCVYYLFFCISFLFSLLVISLRNKWAQFVFLAILLFVNNAIEHNTLSTMANVGHARFSVLTLQLILNTNLQETRDVVFLQPFNIKSPLFVLMLFTIEIIIGYFVLNIKTKSKVLKNSKIIS